MLEIMKRCMHYKGIIYDNSAVSPDELFTK